MVQDGFFSLPQWLSASEVRDKTQQRTCHITGLSHWPVRRCKRKFHMFGLVPATAAQVLIHTYIHTPQKLFPSFTLCHRAPLLLINTSTMARAALKHHGPPWVQLATTLSSIFQHLIHPVWAGLCHVLIRGNNTSANVRDFSLWH